MSQANSNPRVRFLALLALFGALGVLALAMPPLALAFAPAAIIFAFLAAGRMPGEEQLTRLVERGRHTARALCAPAEVARPRLPLVIRRTGRLIAAALAVRPPPLPFRI